MFSELFISKSAAFNYAHAKKFGRHLQKLRTCFFADNKGSIAVTFGLSLIPVMLSVGIAVDYTRMLHTKSIVDDALDAAVLMSGKALSDGQPVNDKFHREFREFFQANLYGRTKLAKNVKIQKMVAKPSTGIVEATATSDVDMTFMALIGKKTIKIISQSEAQASSNKVELAMMLDVTGSMQYDGKMNALKSAANDAINILLPAKAKTNNIRISLVPYSDAVNVGIKTAQRVSKIGNNKCVTERNTNRFNDVSYSVSRVEGQSKFCPQQEVIPLTNKPKKLINSINKFIPKGVTAGHLGVVWSYYTLSPNWNNAWPNTPDRASYSNKKIKKIVLLMTDGEFNTDYGDGKSSAKYAVSTCRDMKDKGILIYSVAFKAPSNARTMLRSCASPDSNNKTYYYSADSSADLKTAFRNIANNIKHLRLSK